MAKKILIRKGLQYRSKTTQDIFTLQEDYNGLWFLDCRDENGYKKTLSKPKLKMLSFLEESFVRV